MNLLRRMLRCLAWSAVVAALLGATPALDRFRGGTVEWTRLDTGTPYWNRHAESDGDLLAMMREHTSLNIGREWRSTRPSDLAQLCRYPFVYTDNIVPLNAAEARNLAEYLRRGGFLLIDACLNSSINRSPDTFLENQVFVLRRQFPELQVVELLPRHEVFSIYFQMKEFPPKARPTDGGSWLQYRDFPLRGLMVGDRMIGMLSLSGFQCAWSYHRANVPVAVSCMEMVTNIYIYAMTR